MKFWEAMKHLQEGRRVRGFMWPSGEYLILDQSTGIIRDEKGNVWTLDYIPHIEWEVYIPKKEAPEVLVDLYEAIVEADAKMGYSNPDFVVAKKKWRELYEVLYELNKTYDIDRLSGRSAERKDTY